MTHSYDKCPTCGADASHLETYDIGSGPELSCPNCEWCWGAEGQPLKPLDPAILRLGYPEGESKIVSTWDYRIVHRVIDDEEEYDVREIYYDDAGRITMWTQEPVGPHGATHDELMADVELMVKASLRPVLEYVDLPGSRRTADRPGGEPDS